MELGARGGRVRVLKSQNHATLPWCVLWYDIGVLLSQAILMMLMLHLSFLEFWHDEILNLD